jgi:hypothetical protein
VGQEFAEGLLAVVDESAAGRFAKQPHELGLRLPLRPLDGPVDGLAPPGRRIRAGLELDLPGAFALLSDVAGAAHGVTSSLGGVTGADARKSRLESSVSLAVQTLQPSCHARIASFI